MVAIDIHLERRLQIIASVDVSNWLFRALKSESKPFIKVSLASGAQNRAQHFWMLIECVVAKVPERTVGEADQRRDVILVELLGGPKDRAVATERDDVINHHPFLVVLVLEEDGQLALGNHCLVLGIVVLSAFYERVNDPLVDKQFDVGKFVRDVPKCH